MSVDGQRPPALAVVFGAPSMGDDSEVRVFWGPGPHRRHSIERELGGERDGWRCGAAMTGWSWSGAGVPRRAVRG